MGISRGCFVLKDKINHEFKHSSNSNLRLQSFYITSCILHLYLLFSLWSFWTSRTLEITELELSYNYSFFWSCYINNNLKITTSTLFQLDFWKFNISFPIQFCSVYSSHKDIKINYCFKITWNFLSVWQ